MPAATTVSFSDADDLALKLAAAGTAARGMRFVAPKGFASIDFWEAVQAGSNASVSTQHDLIVQGDKLQNGWRAIASAVQPARAASDPIIHLWLVPGVIYDEVKAGPLKIATRGQKPIVAKVTSDMAAARKMETEKVREREEKRQQLNRAIDEATALAPFVVQYALELPAPSV